MMNGLFALTWVILAFSSMAAGQIQVSSTQQTPSGHEQVMKELREIQDTLTNMQHSLKKHKCDDGLLDAVVALATPKQQSAGTSLVMDKLHALELQLQATRTDLQTTKAELQTSKAELQTTRTDLEGRLTAVNGSVTNRGSSYVRWGHTSCPGSSELVYTGIIGGPYYKSKGGAGNHLCLTSDPVLDNHQQPSQNVFAKVYGSEYDICPEPQCQMTPACALCRVARATSVMVPGTNTCSPGWTKEYSGYIMAGYPEHTSSSEFICVDSSKGTIDQSKVNENPNILYYTHVKCGPLPCPPYVDDKLLTCVVCSK